MSVQISLNADGNMVEMFEKVSALSEVFGIKKCDACGSEDIVFRTRTASKGKKEFKFHELHCQNPKCRARLSFGQHATGNTLFPKRKDSDGVYLENNGWVKYVKPEDE